MSDTISSLLGAADRDMPKIKRKGNKFVVDGDDQEYETMEEAIKAAARLDAGPTMTAGNPDMTSALDNMDYQEAQPQPSAKAPPIPRRREASITTAMIVVATMIFRALSLDSWSPLMFCQKKYSVIATAMKTEPQRRA